MSVSALEQKLARLFGYDYAVMTGRARSALVALIEILHRQGTGPLPVVLPENICPALVTAIRAGGGRAVLVPVSPVTGLPGDQAFVGAMTCCEPPGIVMPTHLYGFLGDYPATVKYARDHGWFTVENDTNAVRMTPDSPPFGDALLVSFGYAKPIEIGSGGAILTNDKSLARTIRQRVSDYAVLDNSARIREQKTMLRRRAIREKLDIHSAELARICDVESSLSRFRFDEDDADRLTAKLDQFADERARRIERRDMWDQLLAPLDQILLPVALSQPVPWRLIRRVPSGRDCFAQSLWRHNIDAGINYRSLRRELPPDYLDGKSSLLDPWGDMVLNLWLTEDYDQPRIEKAVQILMESANEL